jgi:hypothetical protein
MPAFPPRSTDNLDGPTDLEFIQEALTATGRLPCKRPNLGMPAHFTFENMENLYVERHGAGWVANIQFREVPEGQPDCIGTPNAAPFDDKEEALMNGMALVCLLATGSPELPFVKVGKNLVVPGYRA